MEVDGLEGVRRLPSMPLTISADRLAAAQAFFVDREVARQAAQPSTMLTVKIRPQAIALDGNVDAWAGSNFVTVDNRVTQVGDWGHRNALTTAALTVSGDKLYVAVQTDDAALLTNSGESLQDLFKTGGAIDLMLGSNASADPKRTHPVAGDERLLVTRVKDKTTAMLYRQIGANGVGTPADYASPLRSIHFDSLQDVSDQVILATNFQIKDGVTNAVFEFSIPLSVVGLAPTDGMTIKGDIGILRGNGYQTLQRVYWSNKATGLVSDLPSEAELTPQLWGQFTFATAPK